MSRAYRITVSESVRRHVKVSDGVRTQLELLDVLPVESMADLLAAELGQRGFTRDGDDMVRVEPDGVEIRIGVKGASTGHVTVRLACEKELAIEVERSMRGYDENEIEIRADLEDQVARAIEERAEDAEASLSEEVTARLEGALRNLRRELDQIGNRVTARALEARARQIGEIREITEDPETGSLTIKVRV